MLRDSCRTSAAAVCRCRLVMFCFCVLNNFNPNQFFFWGGVFGLLLNHSSCTVSRPSVLFCLNVFFLPLAGVGGASSSLQPLERLQRLQIGQCDLRQGARSSQVVQSLRSTRSGGCSYLFCFLFVLLFKPKNGALAHTDRPRFGLFL